ncbi:unnamed protein product [Closterium sp. Naga37s-1]|nr:unnamed protein product [Closterium sp. Naga37s-1]
MAQNGNSTNGNPGTSSNPNPTAPASATTARPQHRRARATTQGNTGRRLEVIDLDTIIAQVPDPSAPLNANDDTLAYFDAGEVESDAKDNGDDDDDTNLPGEKRGWQDAELMQLAWVRHDKDTEVHSQTRLQGQNKDVTVWDELKQRHPTFRHKFAAVKAKLFRMEAHCRKVRGLLLEPSGKGRPPKIPIFYDIYDRIFGDRANVRPPAIAGSLPGANGIGTPPTTPGIADQAPPNTTAGITSPPRRTMATPSPSPSLQRVTPLSPPAPSPLGNALPVAVEAPSPPSRIVGAPTGLGLRGSRSSVVRRPGPAAAEADMMGMEGGSRAFGSQMNNSDSSLCDEIAAHIVGTVQGMMRENFTEFMALTRELVQSPPDDPATKKRKGSQPDADGGGSA